MPVRRTSRKLKRESESIQGDLLAQPSPVCSHCKGEGRTLYTIRGSHSTQSDWALMKFNAQAFGTWETLKEKEPHFAEFIEKKIKRGKWKEGDRYYQRCNVCNGAGRITPEHAAGIWTWLVWRYKHHFPARDEFIEAIRVHVEFNSKADQLVTAYEKRAARQRQLQAQARRMLDHTF